MSVSNRFRQATALLTFAINLSSASGGIIHPSRKPVDHYASLSPRDQCLVRERMEAINMSMKNFGEPQEKIGHRIITIDDLPRLEIILSQKPMVHHLQGDVTRAQTQLHKAGLNFPVSGCVAN